MDTYQAHHNRHLVNHHQLSRTTESKPRLSKEEVEVLEAEFQKNHKPSSTTKKALAESMRVDNARINNWFQNRRAREKKENNIREYEARQKLEKEKADADSGSQTDNSRQCDLVASSAPFPEPSNLKVHADAALSPSAQSLQETASETTEQSQGSPAFFAGQNQPASLVRTDSVESDQDDDVASVELSENADGYFAMSQACAGVSATESDSVVLMESRPTAQTVDEYQDFMAADFEGSCFAHTQSMSGDSEAKSPHAVDIASRRNRRPAPLAITGSRSYSSYAPKTAIDMSGKRGDRTSPMRRVASASGSGRVKKSVSTPRSPFFDGVFPSRRSPSAAGPQGTGAPPTPDTPIALNHQGVVDGTASYSLDNKYLSTDMTLQDPTLRTPPTTPGFMDSLFPIGSGYDMSISEETLVAPSMGRLPNGFSVSAVQSGLPGYVGAANNGTSQVQANPSLLSSQIGSTYLNFLGTGVDYSWPESSMRPSSASQQQPGGYLNMAPAAFSHVEN
ncbi:hypothetical protein PLICBS_002668 [Purpureocillium lilacinum]|nr:hypothetical protein PLICBS_002668 [Purpureocillium lilacinum]